MPPFEECQGCVAQPFCKAFSGEVELQLKTWCRPKHRLDLALKLTEIPKKYLNANRYNFKADADNQHVLDEITPYLDDIVNTVDEGKNFFFYGHKPGTGKTYAGVTLLNEYVYKTSQAHFDFENPLALYVSYDELAHDMKFGQLDEMVQHRFEIQRNVPLLMIDDIGVVAMSDTVRDQTSRLINSRLNAGLSTIVTTNYTIQELNDNSKLGPRIVSRLMDDTLGIEITGKDRRKFK
ncbi:ATP-binding protein [Paenibacillus xylanexedens]|uniref:ATP-binding protein n=1 Tax=Paenibacillus xylanexedens TaxID=528191 RepID=UPI00119DBD1A|nr:ATP-binding protein [Paenibacillus xylanexedens]